MNDDDSIYFCLSVYLIYIYYVDAFCAIAKEIADLAEALRLKIAQYAHVSSHPS
jgi:hypothetical protein